MIFNLHTHTDFSDGSSPPEDYVKEAISQGFDTLGFSDHSPVPFENNFALKEENLENYINVVQELKKKYSKEKASDGITILQSLEIDFIPGITKPIDYYRGNYDFDYFIGSVHLVKNLETDDLWFIDGPDIKIYDAGLEKTFSGNARKAVTAYYHQIQEMIMTQKPDLVGHMDKIKMYNRNRFFSEQDSWYVKLVETTLEVAKHTDCIIEVNTRGIYKKRSETLFPEPAVLKSILKHKIPVTISSDAHKPCEISFGFGDAVKTLVEIGFKSIWMKTKDDWKEVAID